MRSLSFNDQNSGDKTLTGEDIVNELFMKTLLQDYLYASAQQYPEYKNSLESCLLDGTDVPMYTIELMRKNPKRNIHTRVPKKIISTIQKLEERVAELEGEGEKWEKILHIVAEEDADVYHQNLKHFLFGTGDLDDETKEYFTNAFKTDPDMIWLATIPISEQADTMGFEPEISADLPAETIRAIQEERARELKLDEKFSEKSAHKKPAWVDSVHYYLFNTGPDYERSTEQDESVEADIMDEKITAEQVAAVVISAIKMHNLERGMSARVDENSAPLFFRHGVAREVLNIIETHWMEQEIKYRLPLIPEDNGPDLNLPHP